ncbi:MAG TPA: DUF2905 domain-containing protein [Nitrospiraceae bacterium]|nr:DUF2905 domain-containing protein [Nitrospiraceae bacterium]
MSEWNDLGKFFLFLGVILALIGALLIVVGKLPNLGGGVGWLGKLPGDILIKRDNFSFYFPLATSVLISVVVSLLLYLLSLLLKR